MKKTIIAGASVAAFGLAAVPFMGVYADHTDTVTVNVSLACSMSATSATHAIGDYIPGNAAKTVSGAAMTVVCNKGGWKISAIAAGTGTNKSDMVGSDGGTISTAAGTGTTTSNWGFYFAKSGSGAAGITSGYDSSSNPKAIPLESTVIATGGTYNNNTTNTITPTYRVYVASGQAAGLYTGKVTYSFTQPAA